MCSCCHLGNPVDGDTSLHQSAALAPLTGHVDVVARTVT